MVEPLSARQWAVLKVILSVTDATGEAPSMRTLARTLDVSLHTIQDHLGALHRKGWLVTPSPDGLRCGATAPTTRRSPR